MYNLREKNVICQPLYMQRKKFLSTTLAAFPLLAFAQLKIEQRDNDKPFVVKAGKSRDGSSMKYRNKHPNDVIISKKDTGGNLSVFLFTGYDTVGPSLHVHFNQDEIFYVLEGNYRFVVGSETMELEAGDTIFLPRNIPHSWIQLTPQGRLLYAAQPAGTLEDFFREMNDLAKPPTHEESQQIHLKHGMKIMGPALKL